MPLSNHHRRLFTFRVHFTAVISVSDAEVSHKKIRAKKILPKKAIKKPADEADTGFPKVVYLQKKTGRSE
jgi:hypothetical protein